MADQSPPSKKSTPRSGLPPSVRVRSGRAYLVRREDGKHRWVPLCRVEDGETAIWTAYEEARYGRPGTVGEIIDRWIKGAPGKLTDNTRRQYTYNLNHAIRPVFGSMRPQEVHQGIVAQFLERRGNVAANREISALSTVYNWAMRKGWVEANPCRGVRRNRETERDRYIRDEELEEAQASTSEPFSLFMEGLYLTGLRQVDLRLLTWSQVQVDGILVRETKGGKKVILEWSDALRALVERARARSRCEYVFTNTQGRAWTFWAIQSAMRRLKGKTGGDHTLHDVRAKAHSDHPDPEGLGLLTRYKRAIKLKPVR